MILEPVGVHASACFLLVLINTLKRERQHSVSLNCKANY